LIHQRSNGEPTLSYSARVCHWFCVCDFAANQHVCAFDTSHTHKNHQTGIPCNYRNWTLNALYIGVLNTKGIVIVVCVVECSVCTCVIQNTCCQISLRVVFVVV